MAAAKTERLINLTLALMAAPRPLTVADLGRMIEGYDPDETETGGEAFRRMFERDKEELRELGIPLLTEQVDPLWGDELGYRIPREHYALPEVAFDPDEAAAVGLAARLWSSAELAAASSQALRKLDAAGGTPLPPPVGLDARIDAVEPAFGPLYDAVLARRLVRFRYARPGAVAGTRALHPWGLLSWRGRWYVAGWDLDRRAQRSFRLSRVEGAVAVTGPAGVYEIPPDTNLRALVTSGDPRETGQGEAGPGHTARLRLTPGAGQRLRRGSTPVGGDPDLVDVPVCRLEGLADLVVSYGPDVLVLGPPELRDLVVARLRAVLAAGAPAEDGRAS